MTTRLRRWAAAMLAPLIGAAMAAQAAPTAPTVKVADGLLQGAQADGVSSFKAIPFAAPPVGQLRWRPPAPSKPWPGVRKADAYGPICMQRIAKDDGVGPGPASEDCLTLNVFTPHASRRARLPVMVWIHGGGLVNGSGTAALYDGSALARQGVVVVTLNYRLGRLGFFAHPALTAEAGPADVIGNFGLMDQIAALKWVRTNIAQFGGDPGRVTLFGESAGGMSVQRLMMIPAARPLFIRAISESGLGRERSHSLQAAEADGVAFIAKVAPQARDAAALRAIPASTVIAAGDPDIYQGQLPILDGRMLREDVDKAFAGGRVARIPFLVGSNSLELPRPFLGARLDGLIATLPADLKPRLIAAYGGQTAFDDHVGSDMLFGEPARTLARDVAERGSPVWLYRFSILSDKAPPILKGAPHASDRAYVFRTLKASQWPSDARDEALAVDVSAYWVAFAKTGDPNGGGRPVWPRYDHSDRLINFTNEGPKPQATPDAAALDLLGAAAARP